MTRVGVLGPGRVGTALALALRDAGDDVVAVAGRGSAALAAFSERLPDVRVLDPVGVSRAAELVVVAVPDDVLPGLVAAVAARDGVVEGARWVHVAGGAGTEVLRPARLAGAAVAACHPAQTFPDADTGRAALPGTAWAVTAAESDRAWAAALVRRLGGTPVEIPARARLLYHAGLVAGANFTAAVVALARDLLLGAGIADPAAFLAPLAPAAAAAAAERGPAALTGPVRRGDAGTVARHLDELRDVLPEAVDAYIAVSRLALRQARRAGLDADAAAAVEKVLAT